MENALLIVTLVALSIIVILMVIVLYLGHQLLKAKMIESKKGEDAPQYKISEEILKRLSEIKGVPSIEEFQSIDRTSKKKNKLIQKSQTHLEEQFYCFHHPSEMTVGSCDICEHAFCAHCLKNHKSLHFCTEHLQLFLMSKWEIVTTVKTNPDEVKKGVELYDLKKSLWEKEKIPSFLETQYKIDVENDQIESFVALYARIEDLQNAKTQYQMLK